MSKPPKPARSLFFCERKMTFDLKYLPSIYAFALHPIPLVTTPFFLCSKCSHRSAFQSLFAIPSNQPSFPRLSPSPTVPAYQGWDKCDWFCMDSMCRVWGCSDGSDWGCFVRLCGGQALACCRARPKKPHSTAALLCLGFWFFSFAFLLFFFYIFCLSQSRSLLISCWFPFICILKGICTFLVSFWWCGCFFVFGSWEL